VTTQYGAWSKPHHGNFCDHYATTADGMRCERCGATRVLADSPRPRCAGYIPAEYYGSICECGRGAESHRNFNPDGGAW